MALSTTEALRLKNLEETIQELKTLLSGAGSKNQLHRLLVLAQRQVDLLDAKVTSLEVQVSELLVLAQKLQ